MVWINVYKLKVIASTIHVPFQYNVLSLSGWFTWQAGMGKGRSSQCEHIMFLRDCVTSKPKSTSKIYITSEIKSKENQSVDEGLVFLSDWAWKDLRELTWASCRNLCTLNLLTFWKSTFPCSIKYSVICFLCEDGEHLENEALTVTQPIISGAYMTS